MSRTFGNSYTISGTGTISAGGASTPAQINEDFIGVAVYIPITAVTGYDGNKLGARLQWSIDGTTWNSLNGSVPDASVGGVEPILLTAGPSVFLQGGGVDVNYGGVLPRTWRVLFTLSGSATDSYTIGDILVEYLY